MIAFVAPVWLWGAGAVALAGAWALWRGQRRAMPVPSLRLWRGLATDEKPVRRRRVDPLWVLVLVAAILAAVALAGPVWRIPAPPLVEVPALAAVVRETVSAESSRVEAWLKMGGASDGGERWTLFVDDGEVATIADGDVRAGISVPLTLLDSARAALRLERGGARVERVFTRPAFAGGRAFGLVQISPKGATDGALERVYRQAPGARDDPATRPRIVLVTDAGFSPIEAMQLAGSEPGLLIALDATPLPGIVPGVQIAAEGEGWAVEVAPASPGAAFTWPAFVRMETVRVHAVREVTLAEPWQVLARVNGKPWLACRRAGDGRSAVWVWIGSQVETQTGWWKDKSFVLFFAALANHALGDSGGGIVEWQQEAVAVSPAAPVKRETRLSPYLGITTIILLAAATLWQFRRNAPGRPA